MLARQSSASPASESSRHVWPLQLVVGLVFTCLLLMIAGGLVLYNHAQLTRFAKRQAYANFDAITQLIRNDRQAEQRTSDLLLDMATSLIDPNLPREQLQTTLLGLMRSIQQALPSTFAIVMAYPDGGRITVQDLRRERPAEIAGLGDKDAMFGLNVVDRSSDDARESWVLYDRDGREIARTAHFATQYDARQRGWYRQAMSTAATIVSAPYAFSNASGAGFTLARSIPNRPGTAFGLDFTLADLDHLLARGARQVGATETVVFDREGRLIAHPEGEKLRRQVKQTSPEHLPRLAELGDPVLSELARTFEAYGFDGDSHFTVDSRDYIARFEPAGVEVGDYVLGIAIPESLLMGEAYRIRLVLLTAAGIAILVGLVLVFLAARRIVAPLKLASRDLGDIVQLRFGRVRPVRSRIAEVSELGRAVATLEPVLRNFVRYVPFALVRGMIDETFSTELGGRRQPLCILFSDVVGFTGLAERLDPDTLTHQTSRYFAEIGREIVRSSGTIDKYIGDAVMAFWNAPEPQEDFVGLACLGALRASRRVDGLNAEFRAEGAPEMPTRFGLHVGEAVIGNIGSADRMNYTALGHVVNVASRLEGLNRQFGTIILVSDAVVEQAGPGFVFRPVGETVPRGASQPIRLYELMGAWIDEEPDLVPHEPSTSI